MQKSIFAIFTMLALIPATAAVAAGQDNHTEVGRIVCANPANATQKAICEDEELRRMDGEMKQVLDTLMTRIPEDDERARSAIIYSQQRFARLRHLCQGNLPCLKRVYASRLKTLRARLATR